MPFERFFEFWGLGLGPVPRTSPSLVRLSIVRGLARRHLERTRNRLRSEEFLEPVGMHNIQSSLSSRMSNRAILSLSNMTTGKFWAFGLTLDRGGSFKSCTRE